MKIYEHLMKSLVEINKGHREKIKKMPEVFEDVENSVNTEDSIKRMKETLKLMGSQTSKEFTKAPKEPEPKIKLKGDWIIK